MQYIDIENWKRKEHFRFFYRMDYPQYNICLDVDITRFLQFTKKNQLSFYYSMIYAVSDVLNTMENFKYRIRDGQVVLHETIHPSFTDMNKDTADDLFKIVTVKMTDTLMEFVKTAGETSANQTNYFEPLKPVGRDDLIYISSIPWLSFTHISHTISLNRNESVPRISWGKYFKKEDKTLLPFSVQVNHALADGIHIGKYIEKLQVYLDNIYNE